MEDKITQWVKGNIGVIKEILIYECNLIDFQNYLKDEHLEYLNDYISEVNDSYGYAVFSSLFICGDEGLQIQINAAKQLMYNKLKEDLIQRIDYLREQEEAEEDDHGMKPSDFLMPRGLI